MDVKQLQGYLDTSNRPTVTATDVKGIVADVFGLEIMDCHELDSYIDRNFRIKTRRNDVGRLTKNPGDFVLKVLNSSDSSTPDVPAAQLDVMSHLTRYGILCPDVIRTVQGGPLSTWRRTSEGSPKSVNNSSGGGHVVFLCSFVPGRVLYSVRPYSTALGYSCGLLLGQVDRALMDFAPSASLADYKSPWDLRSTVCLGGMVYVLKAEKDRELVEEVVKVFREHVIPREAEFKQGVIHGDFSDHNILVTQPRGEATKSDEGTQFVASGIVDFGDTSVSCYVYELAILICYLMLDSPEEQMFDIGGHAVAGYLTNMNMSDTEWNALRECVLARMCQSVVMGAYTRTIHSSNDYTQVTSKRGWNCLRQLWSFPRRELLCRWKAIVASYQC